MPGTWRGDSGGGAKGGERSSTHVPVQREERWDEANEEEIIRLSLCLVLKQEKKGKGL